MTKPDADEPVFVLRAADALAPDIVTQWARMATRVGVAPEKVASAVACAAAMLLWQKTHPTLTKFPD